MAASLENSLHRLVNAPRADDQASAMRAGAIGVRLASGNSDIDAAQELRYRVFYEEMGASPSVENALLKRDKDVFDISAEHLLVVDYAQGGRVVGTYRLLRRRFPQSSGGFYTAREFDISKLTRAGDEILEVGRSCVAPEFRSRATMALLWRGLAAYARDHEIDLMFGCASFPGRDPGLHAEALSYLHHHHLAPSDLRPSALPSRRAAMNLLDPREIDQKRTLAKLPPLVKGYLRLGGWVGDGAVIDEQFNTTDVCVIVRMENLSQRYSRHYARTLRGVRLQ